MSRSRVLVVDDDEVARGLLRGVLERAGHEVREAVDGREGLRELYSKPADLVILDVTIPELDGWATLERIRDLSDVPVLMLTAREAELERVRGLRGGADDYVVKPFGHQELAARVHALLRRAGPRAEEQPIYADPLVTIDFAQRAVSYGGQDVRLTPLEFKLLTAFVRNPNQVLSRDQLLDLVWGDSLGVSPEQVKLYVGYLRRKLDPGAPDATPIETVRGFGYRYRRPSMTDTRHEMRSRIGTGGDRGKPGRQALPSRGMSGRGAAAAQSREATIRIVLADDHQVVRSGLRMLLDSESGLEVVAEAGDVDSARRYVRGHHPAVLVLDLNMPGGSSLAAIPVIREESPETQIVVLTMQQEPVFARHALSAGAIGYVLKEAADEELVEAVRRAAAGESYLNPRLGARLASEPPPGPPDDLSEREVDVLRLIALGHTNAEIAERLYLSVRTVETHRAHIQQKLRLSSRAELVGYALKRGLINAHTEV